MLEKIEKLNIETSKLRSDGTYGMFVLEPLQSGYGNTLGNSLRRVLLSSLPGVAATSVKIDGVQHEFSTVPGVKEDVTELILNIKGLRAKMYGEAPKTIYIEAEGEGEYMRMLAEAYQTQDQKEFYEFTRALDALKASLTGSEKTVILDRDSKLAQILMGN